VSPVDLRGQRRQSDRPGTRRPGTRRPRTRRPTRRRITTRRASVQELQHPDRLPKAARHRPGWPAGSACQSWRSSPSHSRYQSQARKSGLASARASKLGPLTRASEAAAHRPILQWPAQLGQKGHQPPKPVPRETAASRASSDTVSRLVPADWCTPVIPDDRPSARRRPGSATADPPGQDPAGPLQRPSRGRQQPPVIRPPVPLHGARSRTAATRRRARARSRTPRPRPPGPEAPPADPRYSPAVLVAFGPRPRRPRRQNPLSLRSPGPKLQHVPHPRGTYRLGRNPSSSAASSSFPANPALASSNCLPRPTNASSIDNVCAALFMLHGRSGAINRHRSDT